jgi:hypothetical protein
VRAGTSPVRSSLVYFRFFDPPFLPAPEAGCAFDAS